MRQYKQLLADIISQGTPKPAARANMPGSLSLFGHQSRYDLADGFPAPTTKRLNFKAVVVELLWFLKADDNIKFMVDNGCNIWNEDAYGYYLKKCQEVGVSPVDFDGATGFVAHIKTGYTTPGTKPLRETGYKYGDTGNQYPLLWRQWEKQTALHFSEHDDLLAATTDMVDQITNVIKSLRETPESRRHIVTAWNPATIDDMALPACHCFFQFNCRPMTVAQRLNYFKGPDVAAWNMHNYLDTLNTPAYYLDCQLYQRSGDTFLGVPFNIASYSLLIHIFAKMCNMVPGHFIHTIGDAHIYDNHMEAVQEQLSREPGILPTLEINTALDWSKLSIDEVLADINIQTTFQLVGYNPQAAIKAELKTGL